MLRNLNYYFCTYTSRQKRLLLASNFMTNKRNWNFQFHNTCKVPAYIFHVNHTYYLYPEIFCVSLFTFPGKKNKPTFLNRDQMYHFNSYYNISIHPCEPHTQILQHAIYTTIKQTKNIKQLYLYNLHFNKDQALKKDVFPLIATIHNQ